MNFPDFLNSFKAFLISSILADDVPIVESSKNIPEMLESIAAALILLIISFMPALSLILKPLPVNTNPRSLTLERSDISWSRVMYKMLFGLTLITVSDDDAIDEMILVIITMKSTTSNKAEPRNDARNVLKNDFIK